MQLQTKAKAWVRTFLGPADTGNLQGVAADEEEGPGDGYEDPDAGEDGRDVKIKV